jgi:Bacterial regulatory helix-turn-helix protein, lysR family
MSKPSLADLTSFVAVSRHRSFRAAADAIGVWRSSLSHAIRGLEEKLGVRLQEMVPQDMVTVPFGGDVRFLAVAARAYLADNGVPKTPDDLPAPLHSSTPG